MGFVNVCHFGGPTCLRLSEILNLGQYRYLRRLKIGSSLNLVKVVIVLIIIVHVDKTKITPRSCQCQVVVFNAHIWYILPQSLTFDSVHLFNHECFMSGTEKINTLANLKRFLQGCTGVCQTSSLHLWDKLLIGHVWTLVVFTYFSAAEI